MICMKIVFPEINHPIIKSALARCPEIEAVSAPDLTAACELLNSGDADAMIAGINITTRDVVLACREHLPMTGQYFSSCFLMQKADQKLIIADAGICKNPDAEMFEAVILQTYQTATKLFDEPKIALLSFSTFGSGGKDPSIDKITSVLAKIRAAHPEIIIDGEMQLDTAIDPAIAQKKAPNSPVAGRANVLICPDLNSGNILYKALEHFGGWTAAGPIFQGFSKPVSDLSRGSSVDDVELVIKTIKELSND